MKKPQGPQKIWIVVALCAVLMVVVNATLMSSLTRGSVQYVDYSTFLQMVENGAVSAVEIGDGEIQFSVKTNSPWLSGTVYRTYAVEDQYLVERLHANGVNFSGVGQQGVSFLSVFLSIILPLAFYGLMIFWVVKMLRGKGGIGGAMGFGKSGAQLYTVSDGSKKFTDVAGQDEAKEALVELVDFLHRPERYRAIGARLPKGALLVGPPGTGKTLIAQAVAGEANVPFFFVSGSAFVEMFVGTGAARVRDLFKQAQEKAPCIVFIDEIDAIGKRRDGIGMGANDEREQALNQLLAEMDGFDPGKGVVVLGATNRPEILDKALLRPGRFDRRINVDLPDLKGREAILQVHARNIHAEESVDYMAIARATVGASGAELANIINEAALHAVRMGRSLVSQSDLEEAVETVIAGSERKSLVVPEDEKRMVAFHEIGHALVAARQQGAPAVHKITIVPRTSGTLGYTMQVDENEHVLMKREDILNRMAVLSAGRAAEELIFDTCTTGAANDIEQVTKLARAMVARYGMSKKFGMMLLETGGSTYLGGESQYACSLDMAAEVDREVRAAIAAAYDEAMATLRLNAQKLSELANYLLERETITGEEFMEILNQSPLSLSDGGTQNDVGINSER